MSDITALEKQIESANDPKAKVDLLNKLAFAVRFSDFQRAVSLSDEAYGIATRLSETGCAYRKGEAESLINLSWFNADRANYQLALDQASTSIELFKALEDPIGEARSLRLIGRSQMYLGNYLGSLECHLDQLSVSRRADYKEGEASALNALGTLYTRLEEHDEAIRHFRKAQAIYGLLNQKLHVGFAHINCAICYRRMGNLTLAYDDAVEGLRVAKEEDSLYTQTWAHNVIGDIYAAQDEYDEALSHFHQTLNALQDSENSQQWVDASISVGKLYNGRNQPDESLSYLLRALAIAQARETTPDQYRCHEAIADAYKRLGKYEEALRHYEQFHTLKEVAIDQEASYRLAYLDAQHRIETAEKETEIYQLRNVELKQEIASRTETEAALIAAKEEAVEAKLLAESSSRAKSTFLSSMSHELRTPLNAILGFGQLLELDETLDEEQLESVSIILSSGNHLLALINEILDLSKIEAGKFELKPEPAALSHVIDSAINLVQIQAESKGLRLDIKSVSDDSELLLLDETRLAQILVNLLHNAVKFTSDGWVRLEISRIGYNKSSPGSPYQPGSSRYKFTISDSGMGMSPNELESIFKPFEQVGHASSRMQGTGLGLAITNRIVELMGGTLAVESESGVGSTFNIELEFEHA